MAWLSGKHLGFSLKRSRVPTCFNFLGVFAFQKKLNGHSPNGACDLFVRKSIKLSKFLNFVFRYGSIFKSHILGCRCVMIASPAAAKLVLVTKSNLFKPTFPASKERMIGKQAIFFHQDDYHFKLRRLVLRAFSPESIKHIVPDIESIVVDALSSWENRLINTFQEMKIVSHENILFFK